MGHHEEDDMADARKRAKSSRKQIETGGRYKPPEGKNEIRVLETPPDRERDSPALYLEYLVHRNIGPNKRFARCGNKPGQTKNKRCWLCKKRGKLEGDGRTTQAANLAPQEMIAVQVAVKDFDLDEMVGPLLWEMGSGKSADAMGYKIRGVISSDRRNYTDHRKGYNLHFKRTGVGLKTKWGDIDHDDDSSKVPSGIIKQLKPFVDTGMQQYDEQWQKDAYYGRDELKSKGEDNMAAKNKTKKNESDASASDASSSNASSSDSSSSSSKASSSDASSSDASGSNASSSDASGSNASSSDSSSSDAKSKKNKKKGKKDASGSDASSSSSDASGSDASGSDSSSSSSSSSSSKASSSDASGSDASSSSSNASSSDSSSSDAKAKKTKRKPRADKGKARKPKATKKKKK